VSKIFFEVLAIIYQKQQILSIKQFIDSMWHFRPSMWTLHFWTSAYVARHIESINCFMVPISCF